MPRWLRRIAKVLGVAIAGVVALLCAVFVLAVIGWSTRFSDSVTLPNGMILKREFDFDLYGRNDMFAADGRTRLARSIEGVCFNDRYVKVWAHDREYNGLYDGADDRKVPYTHSSEVYAASGLGGNRKACNGYYTAMLGPGLLYEDVSAPFLPRCAWRNLENPDLQDRSWFERPCHERGGLKDAAKSE